MTNEKAIKNIVAYIYYLENIEYIPEDVRKALDIAINGLRFINEYYPISFKDYLGGVVR